MSDFPDHPFWDFSLDLYGRPGVARDCLALQDRLDLDVNLLLFACWWALRGGRPLTEAEWRRLIAGSADWRDNAVRRLRALRRFLKPAGASPDIAGMHARVKALELDAEHVAQLAIAALHDGPQGTPPPPAGRADACAAALSGYVAAVAVRMSAEDRACLGRIADEAALSGV